MKRITTMFAVLALALSVLTTTAAADSKTAGASPERAHKVVERTISFDNDGGTVVGTLAMPTGVKPPVPMVVMFHGFTGTRDELPVIGTDEFMFSRTARLLGEAGIATLRIDFRGSGESDGTFDQTTFASQISDARAALDRVEHLRRIDDSRIGVLGLSQGGLVAASIGDDDRIASMVLWSPVANPVDTYKALLGADNVAAGLSQPSTHIVLPWGAEIDLQQAFFEGLYSVDPVAEITEFDGPLRVVVGARDDIVTPQPYYGQVYLNYHEGPESLVVLDGDHVFDILTDAGPAVLDEAVAETVDWFQSSMP